MLSDEADGARPRRQDVQALDQCHADHGPDGVTGTPRPARRLKISDQAGDLRGGKKGLDPLNVMGRGYAGTGHRSHNSLVQTPGGGNLAGSFRMFYQEVYGPGMTVTPGLDGRSIHHPQLASIEEFRLRKEHTPELGL